MVELPAWYDVDDARTLTMLNEELLCGRRPDFAFSEGYPAPHTREFLLELDAPTDLVTQREASGGVAR